MQELQAAQQMKQAKIQGADIRQKQAAVLIDGENIAVRYAHSLHCFLLADLPQQQACVQELNLFGKDTILRPWQAVSLNYPFRSYTNAGGKNVTDRAMQQTDSRHPFLIPTQCIAIKAHPMRDSVSSKSNAYAKNASFLSQYIV